MELHDSTWKKENNSAEKGGGRFLSSASLLPETRKMET